MDTYRGNFIDRHSDDDDLPAYDLGEDEGISEPPPSPVGQDERRMQVRAYNHWASLLDNRNFPSIEDLDPEALPDFGPYSVLLDFTGGLENPAIQYLGEKLAKECGAEGPIDTLSDVPSRSLLSRITDHYMQILANQAPIGFEAEFVNQRELTILYRGILLPFSSDDDNIDFIYGVINWKELADQSTTEELLQQIDEALGTPGQARREQVLTNWADGPAGPLEAPLELEALAQPEDAEPEDDVLDLDVEAEDDVLELDSRFDDEPVVDVGDDDDDWDEVADTLDDAGDDALDTEGDEDDVLDLAEVALDEAEPASLAELGIGQSEAPRRTPLDLASLAFGHDGDEADDNDDAFVPLQFIEPATDEAPGLADYLASARALAEAASGSEDRTRQALYAAIGKAYDFSIAAAQAPEEYAELVIDSGLSVQERAPMIPVVKLVFGADYDKTRLTEYATALSHAHRIGLTRGALGDYLGSAQGGLKGVIGEERRIKREESGKIAAPRDTPREALARKLRKLDTFGFDAVPAEGSEFTLLVARRLPSGEVVLLGEVADDVALIERAAKKLLG